MDNRLKRFLSLALAMVMVIGMMPANVVFATENEGTPEDVVIVTDPTEENHEPVVLAATHAEGCMLDPNHTGDCVIKCNKKSECTLVNGHADVCMNGETILVDVSDVFSEKGLVAAIATGGNIKLTNNITLSAAITVKTPATLNLNGKSITLAAPAEGETAPAYALINESTLTITGTGNVAGVHNKGTLTTQGGTFIATGSNTYAVLNEGTANIKGGTFEASSGYALRNKLTMTIESGNVEGIYNNHTLTISGGSVTNLAGSHAVHSHDGQLTISGGQFDNNVDTTATIKVSGTGLATISNGTFDTDADGLVLAVEDTANVTINGGNVNDGISVGSGATLTINGGSYQDPGSNSNAIAGTVTVNGGTFTDVNSQALATEYAAAGKIIKFDTAEMVKSGENAVAPVVAKIGTGANLVAYPTLESAIAAGGTIELVASVTVDNTIEVKQPVVLNMNGKTITSNVNQDRVFSLVNGCTSFTVNGGTFASASETDYGVIDIKTGADIVVNGGTYNFDTDGGAIFKGRVTTGDYCGSLTLKDVNITTNHLIFTNYGAKTNSVTVNGGEYVSTGHGAFSVNVIDDVSFTNATITAAAQGIEVEGCGNTNATATFTNNTITVTGGGTMDGGMTNFVIGISSKVNATIVSGTYGSASYVGDLLGLTTSGEKLTIQGGTFNGRICSMNAAGTVSITGGIFNSFTVDNTNGGKLVISGGNYDANPAAYLAAYYEAVQGENGRYTVQRKDVAAQRPENDRAPFGSFQVEGSEAKGIIDEIINAINNSAVSMPTGVTLVIEPIEIAAERDGNNNILISKIVYDVIPMRGNEPVHNLSSAVTFRLPVPSNIGNYITKAYVHHADSTTMHDIKGSAATGKYIELSASAFSEYTIELLDIDYSNHVARIGNKGYKTVQAAVDAVKNGETIVLMELPETGSYGKVEITLNAAKKFTIDGANQEWAYDGSEATIKISGGAAANQTEPMVTIQNVKFTRVTKSSGGFIQITGTGDYNNVLIKDCNFTGSDNKAMVAITTANTNGVVINGGSGKHLNAYLKNTNGKNLTVKNVSITEASVGMDLGAVQGVNLEGVNITGTTGKYGISMDGSVNNNAVFKNCTITAYLPIMVFNTTANGRIAFEGTNTMRGTVGNGSYWMVLGDDKYSDKAEGTDPMTLKTSGRFVITVTDAALNTNGINYKHADESDAAERKYYTVMPEGVLASAFVFDEPVKGDSRISFEIKGLKASERIVLEIYEGDTKIAESKLVNGDVLYNTDLTAYVGIAKANGSWQTSWHTAERGATYRNIPETAKLIVDGKVLGEVPVHLNRLDTPTSAERVWTDFEGVGNVTLTTGGRVTWHNTLGEAFAAVPANGTGTVTMFADNKAVLSSASEVTNNKTITVTGEGTLDWTKGWMFIGRGENSTGNGTLIFDNAKITAFGDGDATGFNISGAKEGAGNVGDGTLKIVNGSDITVDFFTSRNYVLLDASKLTIKHGFVVGGRPASEVVGDKDAIATMEVLNGAELYIGNTVETTLGYEGNGELIVDNAKLVCTSEFVINERTASEFNVSGTSELNIKKVTGKAINLIDEAVIKDSSVGGAAVAVGTEDKPVSVSFSGTNKLGDVTVTDGVANVAGALNVNELKVQTGTVYTNTESTITAKKIVLDTDEDQIIIDATNLNDEKGAKVIDLDGHEASKAAMATNVSVKDGLAVKRVEKDGDVIVYFEAYIDENKNNTFDKGEGYVTIEEALAEADNGDTVVLLADVSVNAAIEIKKNIVLDLNEHKISSAETNIPALKVTASDATIQNGEISAIKSGNSGIEVAKDAAAEVIGVTVDGKTAGIKAYGNVTIGKDSEIKVQEKGVAIRVYEDAEVTVNGGKVINENGVAIEMNKTAQVEINDGEVIGAPAIYVNGGALTVAGGKVTAVAGNAIVTDAYNDSDSAVTSVTITDGKISGAIIAQDVADGVVPKDYEVSVVITGGDFTNSYLDWEYYEEEYGSIAVSRGNAAVATTFDEFVPFEMIAPNFTCQKIKDSEPVKYEIVPYEHIRIYMNDVSVDIDENNNRIERIFVGEDAYVDGDAYDVKNGKVILLDKEKAKKPAMLITTYGYETKDNDDVQDDYPNAMYVWYAEGKDKVGNIYTSYTVTRMEILDNFFAYNGTSIRVGGENNGIRFFSSVDVNDAKKLMNGTLIIGTETTLDGAKMTQAGTEFWKTNKIRSEVYGGAVGNSFRVFQTAGGRNWFTGVLVGLDAEPKTVYDPIYSRPYAELEVKIGEEKETVTLFGGILTRSIYYVAQQNKDTFAEGSSYDKFVENLIAKGSAYEAELKNDSNTESEGNTGAEGGAESEGGSDSGSNPGTQGGTTTTTGNGNS